MNAAMYAIKVILEQIWENPHKARAGWVRILCATYTDDFGPGSEELRDAIREIAKDALVCSVDSMLVELALRAHRELF